MYDISNSCENRHGFREKKEKEDKRRKCVCGPSFPLLFYLFFFLFPSIIRPPFTTLLESSLLYHSHPRLLLIWGPLMDVAKTETIHHLKQRAMEKERVKKEAVVGDEDGAYDGMVDEDKKRKGIIVGSGGSGKKPSGGGGGMRCCQAEKCTADLTEAKPYHRRHKVCELHAKSQVVLVGGFRQRFCQQCSRFHELTEFDETKRSCRRRLAGHNERRRKISAESNAECSIRKGNAGAQMKDSVCGGQVDEKGRIQITIQENAAYKHFQIR